MTCDEQSATRIPLLANRWVMHPLCPASHVTRIMPQNPGRGQDHATGKRPLTAGSGTTPSAIFASRHNKTAWNSRRPNLYPCRPAKPGSAWQGNSKHIKQQTGSLRAPVTGNKRNTGANDKLAFHACLDVPLRWCLEGDVCKAIRESSGIWHTERQPSQQRPH